MTIAQVLAIVVPVLCTIIFGLLAYAHAQTLARINDKIDRTAKELEAHKDECGEIDKKVINEKLMNISSEVTHAQNVIHWLGNCIHKVAGSLDVELPERPLRRV